MSSAETFSWCWQESSGHDTKGLLAEGPRTVSPSTVFFPPSGTSFYLFILVVIQSGPPVTQSPLVTLSNFSLLRPKANPPLQNVL